MPVWYGEYGAKRFCLDCFDIEFEEFEPFIINIMRKIIAIDFILVQISEIRYYKEFSIKSSDLLQELLTKKELKKNRGMLWNAYELGNMRTRHPVSVFC